MTILTLLANFLRERRRKKYEKYKKELCPECNNRKWKYSFTPFIQKNKKGMLTARICDYCHYRDKKAYFISDDIKIDDNTI
jgi:hypothetical protein